jgi:hypothetical protein
MPADVKTQVLLQVAAATAEHRCLLYICSAPAAAAFATEEYAYA